MKDNIKLTLYIKAGQAESGPPLGTILGNIGVQTVKFCKEFNEFSKDLPLYFLLKVKIIISVLKKEEKIKKKDGTDSSFFFIYFEDVVKLAKFKFPEFSLERSIKII